MEGPLTGVKVLEVANWLAAPAGCALLADFSAEVIKVEPPGGDPYRGIRLSTAGYSAPFNFAFEVDNRGKRDITLNLDDERAAEVIYRLVAGCDVFVTNLLPRRREYYRLTYGDLTPHRPDLIYATLTGYGSLGPDRDRAGYDYAAFWARSGIMALMGEPDAPPTPQRPGMGDHTTALLIAGAVAMALLHRDRTGEGQEIDVSLHNTGLWVAASDVQAALVTGRDVPRTSRRSAPNPLFNSYQTKDGRWIMLVMLVSDMYWPRFCRAIGRPALETDTRYETFDGRLENREELITLLDAVFAQRTLRQWSRLLDGEGCIWAPAQTLTEAINDPQSRAREAFVKIAHPIHGDLELVDTPVKFSRATVGARQPAPELGQHTEEVLLEAGYNWDDIAELREHGVI